MARYLILLLKLTLSFGLVWYAFTKIDTATALVYLKLVPAEAIVAALATLLLQTALVSIRLRLLLRELGSNFGLTGALDAVFVGAFFSQTFISFVGGDAMRVWRIAKKNVSVNVAVKAVLFDRIFGFVGLILLILLSVPLLLQVVTDSHMRGSLVLLIALAIAGCIAFMLMHRLPVGFRRWRVIALAADLSLSAKRVVRGRGVLLKLMVLSLLIQVLNVVSIFVVAAGTNIEITFLHALVLLPPVLFLSMMPISFAGWGVREGAMIVALGLVGVPAGQSLALSIFYGLCLIVISLPGGVLWFIARKRALVDGGEPAGRAATPK